MTALISGGCIRLYDTGPEWHINTAHHTIGLIDTSTPPAIDASGMLVFNLIDGNGDPNPHPVVSLTAAADETLTSRGIRAGCSSGTQEVRIRLYKNGVNGADGTALNLNNAVHYSRASGSTSNLWITTVHDVP